MSTPHGQSSGRCQSRHPHSVQPWRLWPSCASRSAGSYVRDAPTWAEIQRDLTFGPEPPTGTTTRQPGPSPPYRTRPAPVTARLPAAGTTAATSATARHRCRFAPVHGPRTAAAQSATSGSVTAILPRQWNRLRGHHHERLSDARERPADLLQASGTVTVTSATSGTVTAILAASGTVAAISTTSGDATRAGQIYPASGNVTASSATTAPSRRARSPLVPLRP